MAPDDDDSNNDDAVLRTPRFRCPPAPGRRSGRTPPFALRLTSGLRNPERIELQAERDALAHRLDRIDDQLATLTEERQEVVRELTRLRDVLYPPVPWAKGRRPPDLDHAPLPPAAEGAVVIHGRALRATCMAVLRRHGPQALPDLHALLHRYGYVVGARRPVTALSDAMAYEVERHRAQRVCRGTYAAADERRRRHARPEPPLPQLDDAWLSQRPSPTDPAIDEDPATSLVALGQIPWDREAVTNVTPWSLQISPPPQTSSSWPVGWSTPEPPP